MSKKYLVTGGSGFIGAALVHKLLREGNDVRVFDNGFRGNMRRLSSIENDIDYVQGDIRNLDDVMKATEGVDVVCHLAFVNGTEFFYSKPDLVLEVGVKGIMNTIDAAIHHQVKDFMVMSSSEVYQTPERVPTDETAPFYIPDPLNPRYSYGGGKIISELVLLNYAPKHFDSSVIVRPHNVYGPDMGWEHVVPQFILRMKKLAEESDGEISFPIQGTGQETRAFVYIDDFIEGTYLAIKNGKQQDIFHVGTLDEVDVKTVAETIGSCYSRMIQVVPGEVQKGGTTRRCPDISKVKKFGYQPKVSLEEGLRRTVEWYDSHAHLAPDKK